MALNQRINATPGLALVAILEQPVEPGSLRQYWDGSKSSWAANPAARLAVIPDPDNLTLGLYLIQIPTAITATWPDKVYSLTVYDPNAAERDEVHVQLNVAIVGGDDGGNGIPSWTIPLPGFAVNGSVVTGATVTIYNARVNGLGEVPGK